MMFMKFVSVRTFLFVQFYTGFCATLYEGSTCETENQSGICTRISKCTNLYIDIQAGNRPAGSYSRCSFIRDEEVVCCTHNISERISLKRKAEQACEQYRQQSLNYYILNGTRSKSGEFPHMAGVVLYDLLQNQQKVSCGAALISEQYVLTAAHCVRDPNRIPRLVRLGSVSLLNSGGTEHTLIDVEISEIVSHPSYTFKYRYHDIALIKLNRSLQFNSNVRPACLYTDTTHITEEQTLVGTGWGVKNVYTQESSDYLLKVNLHLVNTESCNSTYYEFGYHDRRTPQGLINTQICAFSEDNGDTCQGDSGGPLQLVRKHLNGDQIFIVGVVSYGAGCGGLPGVYTKVQSYLDWIESVVWP